MEWIVGIVSVGVVLLITLLSRRAAIDRRARDLEGSDPEIAEALRKASRDIDQGSFLRQAVSSSSSGGAAAG